MSVQLKRDPFARASFMRERLTEQKECKECGQPAKFTYRWEQDRLYSQVRGGKDDPFCSVGCFRVYNNQ